MLLKEIKQLDESISSEIQNNLDWLKEVFVCLNILSRAGRFDNKFIIKLEELFTTLLPTNLDKFFKPSNVRLGRVTGVNINVKEYIETGKLSIYTPMVTSFFKIASANQFNLTSKHLASTGAGFMKNDFNGDPETFNGFGIAFILPTNYIKAIIPFQLLIKLALKNGISNDKSLLLKANSEREVMVLLNNFKLDLTSKDIVGIIRRDSHDVKLYINKDINSGSLNGYPLFPSKVADLHEH